MSMGQLHHAMMGTASVAIGTAATIKGTLVNQAAGGKRCLKYALVTHQARYWSGWSSQVDGKWQAKKCLWAVPARRLMVGEVCNVPGDAF